MTSTITASASTCPARLTFCVIIPENRDEHTLDLIVCRDFSLEDHITEFDRFFLDRESWILSDPEFHLVGRIIRGLYLHTTREREFREGLIHE